MARGAFRLAVLGASLAVSAACVWALIRARAEKARTEIVDVSGRMAALLSSEAGGPARARPLPGEPGWPAPIALRPFDETTAKLFWPQIGGGIYEYDPLVYLRLRSHLDVPRKLDEHPAGGWRRRTNSLGLRDVVEVAAVQPDLRVLVTGASNVEAVCAPEETAVELLEAALLARFRGRSVEALNAGVGGYNFFNYLAVLERYRGLAPDVFVVIVYGGTDFHGAASLERYHDRRGPPSTFADLADPMRASDDEFARELLGTELAAAMYFARNPDDVDIAADTAAWLTLEIERRCHDAGIALVFAYLPPPLRGQPQHLRAVRDEVLRRVPLDEKAYEVSDVLADRWLALLGERGLAHVDLRPSFRESETRYYWETDTHTNVAGQRALAAALLPKVLAAARARGLGSKDGSSAATPR